MYSFLYLAKVSYLEKLLREREKTLKKAGKERPRSMYAGMTDFLKGGSSKAVRRFDTVRGLKDKITGNRTLGGHHNEVLIKNDIYK